MNGVTQENITYTYDTSNHLSRIHDNLNASTPDTAYIYDTNGNRVMELNPATSAGTIFITDSNNPTGYAQTLEERSFALFTSDDGTLWYFSLHMSYLLGLSVLAQSAGGGTSLRLSILLTDGHGNTRILTSYKFTGTHNTPSIDSNRPLHLRRILGNASRLQPRQRQNHLPPLRTTCPTIAQPADLTMTGQGWYVSGDGHVSALRFIRGAWPASMTR